jgi:hypothetical protein
LVLLGFVANGLAQAMPLDAAVDREGVTYAGSKTTWDQILSFDVVTRWGSFGPPIVRLRSTKGDILVGPGHPPTIQRLAETLWSMMSRARPAAQARGAE